MPLIQGFSLGVWDYVVFLGYFAVVSVIGYRAGRREATHADDYFLAGHKLPWYVVGTSFIAANISSEHFIGMIGAAYVYGICVAMSEWLNILSFTVLIWLFIPFLIASKVFTTPEFMERRFHPVLRKFFAIVTVISNVVAFLAAVLYGGALALQTLFGWNLWLAIIVLGLVAGVWAIYGGLSSVAWMDTFMIVLMILGGFSVTILGLQMLSGDHHSIVEGFKIMIGRNQAQTGIWADVVAKNAQNLAHVDHYNRLSVIQPVTHAIMPWPNLIFGLFAVSIWYNVINQFMIQRVLGAKNMYHARMGIVLAGYMKIILPGIVVVPGLILFAQYPELMQLNWDDIRPAADTGYVRMLQMLLPHGIRGLFLAALMAAIQSTVNSVLNSTATVFTLDIYRQMIVPKASDRHLVRVGVVSSVIILAISIVLAGYIGRLKGSLFVYIQTLYAFFAPPFSAVFLLGILYRRINAKGAIVAVFTGFALGILMKLYVQFVPGHAIWIEPFAMQGILNWAFCTVVCVIVSWLTPPPAPEQITDQLTVSWRKLNIFSELGDRWYTSVVLWWAVFAIVILGLIVIFSGRFM